MSTCRPGLLALLVALTSCQTSGPPSGSDRAAVLNGDVDQETPPDPRCDALCDAVAGCEGGHRCRAACVTGGGDTAPCKTACSRQLAGLEKSGDACRDALAGWMDCLGGIACGFLEYNAFSVPPNGAPQVACLGLRETLPCPAEQVDALADTLQNASGLLAAAEACSGLLEPIQTAVREEVSSVDRACNSDEDCVLTGAGVSCTSGCGDALPTTALADLEARLQALEPRCEDFLAQGCQPGPVPPCPPSAASCENGRCTAR